MEFTITLRDSDGNVLYSDKEKGTSITRKFLLTTQEIGDNIVTIEVKSKKSPKAEVYTINRKQEPHRRNVRNQDQVTIVLSCS